MKKSKIVLFLGPSGVGKSTLIRELCKLYQKKYAYVVPYTTRKLRKKESDKLYIKKSLFLEYVKQKKIICPNEIYGYFYGPSKVLIDSIIHSNKIPLLDWPINRLKKLKDMLRDFSIKAVYILPPSMKALKERLNKDDRDEKGLRFKTALKELERVKKGEYSKLIDLEIVNRGRITSKAKELNILLGSLYNARKQD